MPIPFSSIPEHIRVAVIEKQDIRNFPKFFECSRDSYSDSNKIRSRFVISPLKLFVDDINQDSEVTLEFSEEELLCISSNTLATIPVRIEAIKLVYSEVTNEVCDWLINFSISTNSFFGCLDARYIRCSSTKFNDLCRTLRINKLCCFYEIPVDFLKSIDPTIIDEIDVISPLSDTDLSVLKIPKMDLVASNISNTGITCLIKEWVANKREIKDIRIRTSKTIENHLILDGMEHCLENNRDPGYSGVCSITKDDYNRLIVKMCDDDVIEMHHVPLK